MTHIIFGVVRCTVNGPSHLRLVSRYTWTALHGLIRYFVVWGIFDGSAFVIRFPATIVSISVFMVFSALNRSVSFIDWLFVVGNDGRTPNSSNKGTNPFGPIVSLIAFMLSRIICLS